MVDPTLVYSTYLGGGFHNSGHGIAIDSTGAAYITGSTDSSDFPTKNAFQPNNNDETNAFVTKLDPSGALAYSTYLGGYGGSGTGYGIAVDSTGAAYVTGSTDSTDFPTKNAFQPRINGGTDAFVTKLDPSGALAYSSYLGGSGDDTAHGIAVDSNGAAYITGTTASIDFPTKNAFQAKFRGPPLTVGAQTYAGSTNAFVTRLDPSGALVYSTYLGGSGRDDEGYGIAVDPEGAAYITGSTNSTDFPIKNAFQPRNGTVAITGSPFVTKLEPSGALAYSTYLGGNHTNDPGFNSDDGGYAIAVDPTGAAYITGSTDSTDFPTKNAFQPKFNGPDQASTNAFVTKLDPSGALAYSTYLGGGGDSGQGIAVDGSGSAYIAGQTTSPDFPTKHAFQPRDRGVTDAFVTKLAPSAALTYSTFLGGSDLTYGWGIAVDPKGAAYITGTTDATDFPTRHAFQPKFKGPPSNFADAFVTKLSAFSVPHPPPRSRCPAPSGRLAGTSVGPLELELTRSRARALLPIYRVTYNDFDDFCLRGGFGIRADYPSLKLLRELPPGLSARVRGRIVLALTANRFYALHGVRHGTSLAGAAQRVRLRLGKPFHIGLNYWYITPGRRANGILKVRHGTLLEVGLADRALTTGRAAQRRFLKGFPRVGTSM